MQQGIAERMDALELRLLRACRYKLALVERRFVAVSPEATIARIRMRLDRGQQRVDEQQFRLAGSWQILMHAKSVRLQQLHGRLLQQSSFQAVRSRGESCATSTQRLHRALQRRLLVAHRAVEALSGSLLLQSPAHRCLNIRQTIAYLESRGRRAIAGNIERASAAREAFQGRLTALSPLAVLDRGYSLTFTSSGQLVRETSAVSVGETIKTQLARGKVTSTVLNTEDEI
jgi:exodeoxyribonuclease VII large subunit